MSARAAALNPQDWNLATLDGWIDQLAGHAVAVVGDIGLDKYTIGEVERISPEAPVPIVAVRQQTTKLGLAANVADNVAALGSRALLVGVVGKDRTAEDLKGLLRD